MSVEKWTDEQGRDVLIRPHITAYYKDEELIKSDSVFSRGQIMRYLSLMWSNDEDGEYRLSFGKAELEDVVELYLVLCLAAQAPVGFKLEELKAHARISDTGWEIQQLVDLGYFREKLVKGDLVIFPTQRFIDKLPDVNPYYETNPAT